MLDAAAEATTPRKHHVEQGIKAKVLGYWAIRHNGLQKRRKSFCAVPRSLPSNGEACWAVREAVCI